MKSNIKFLFLICSFYFSLSSNVQAFENDTVSWNEKCNILNTLCEGKSELTIKVKEDQVFNIKTRFDVSKRCNEGDTDDVFVKEGYLMYQPTISDRIVCSTHYGFFRLQHSDVKHEWMLRIFTDNSNLITLGEGNYQDECLIRIGF